jgi:light-regulated signal transduction histidine kinase (bacteriophytochrome)
MPSYEFLPAAETQSSEAPEQSGEASRTTPGPGNTWGTSLNEPQNTFPTCFSPCVLFVAKRSLEILSVSDNLAGLLGIADDVLVGRPEVWKERVAEDDWPLFQQKLEELDNTETVSFLHRFTDGFGLTTWVSHSLRKVNGADTVTIHGCLTPIHESPRLAALDQDAVARFIHKLGNQFQLLNLAVSALKKSQPSCRENEIIEQTLDKAIDLTKVFSDCNQTPELTSTVYLLEVIKTATECRIAQFATAGVRLQMSCDSIPEDAVVASDAYMLETALGHVLQNALEAIAGPGSVEVAVSLAPNSRGGTARIRVSDTGCGMPAHHVSQAIQPFFSTKKGHDGLGLTVAARYVELHGGSLRIRSREGAGTEAEIVLPLRAPQERLSG